MSSWVDDLSAGDPIIIVRHSAGQALESLHKVERITSTQVLVSSHNGGTCRFSKKRKSPVGRHERWRHEYISEATPEKMQALEDGAAIRRARAMLNAGVTPDQARAIISFMAGRSQSASADSETPEPWMDEAAMNAAPEVLEISRMDFPVGGEPRRAAAIHCAIVQQLQQFYPGAQRQAGGGNEANEGRKDLLLQAALDLLKKCAEGPYVRSPLEESVFYDGADCDGACLANDIAEVLGMDGPFE